MPGAAAEAATGAGHPDMDPAEASFAAFLEDEVSRAFGALHSAGAPRPAERDTSTSQGSSDEEMEEAQAEYHHDRSDFSGMYS